MNQTEKLEKVVDALHQLADSLALLYQEEKPKEKTVTKSKPEKEAVTLEEVRAVLARKAQEGFTAQIKSILHRHDAEKLSDVNPRDYEEILLFAKELSND